MNREEQEQTKQLTLANKLLAKERDRYKQDYEGAKQDLRLAREQLNEYSESIADSKIT